MIVPLVASMTGALAVFVAAGALTGQFSYSRRRVAARAVTLQRQSPEGSGPKRPVNLLLKDDALSGSKALAALLRRYSWAGRRATLLERAGLPIKVSEYLLVVIVLFAALTAVAAVLSGLLLVGPAFGLAGLIGLEVWVRSRANRQASQFNKQLPTALQSMAVSLKSGFGVMEAVATVAREMDPPLSTEFKRIIDEARLGGSFEAGLAAMRDRIDSPDLRIVARAIEIHRKVGGDLAAILESVSATMREREELRGHVRALTAQQRLGGMIVGLLPLWVLGFFSVASPDFISPLWEESTGRLLLGIGATMEVVAFVAMRRVMTIEV